MSQSASQAGAFYQEISAGGRLWTVRDAGGYPAPRNPAGHRVQPFWSSLSRAEKMVETIPAYSGFDLVEVSWKEFVDKWVPGLTRDAILVGINWSGTHAAGFDVAAESIQRSVQALTPDPTDDA